MNQKKNQGYLRTHERIKLYVADLLEKKDLKEITIQTICLETNVNRSTFYAHFQDIYDVLEQIGNDLNQELLDQYQALSLTAALTTRDYLIVLLHHLKSHRAYYLTILKDTSNPVMRHNMELLNTEVAQKLFKAYNVTEGIGEYYFNFTIAGFFSIILHWLQKNCLESADAIADIIQNLQPVLPDEMRL